MSNTNTRRPIIYTEQPAISAAGKEQPTRTVQDDAGHQLRVHQRETMDGGYDPIGPISIWMKDAYLCSVNRKDYDSLMKILEYAPRLPTDSRNTSVFEVESGLLPKLCKPKEPIR